MEKMWDYLWWVENYLYLCNRLLLVIGAFGGQSSMKNVAIISCSMCSPSDDGVTLMSGDMGEPYIKGILAAYLAAYRL